MSLFSFCGNAEEYFLCVAPAWTHSEAVNESEQQFCCAGLQKCTLVCRGRPPCLVLVNACAFFAIFMALSAHARFTAKAYIVHGIRYLYGCRTRIILIWCWDLLGEEDVYTFDEGKKWREGSELKKLFE